MQYPKAFFTTSTRDDRAHPAHARKMVARMMEQGHKDVLYYENMEGGHGAERRTICNARSCRRCRLGGRNWPTSFN
ncbi:MAG: S9 family peptidase [Candidatus Saccharibacteria bacterium]|nr:S9 family peptidase [Rhodoferax sp.]